MGVRFSQNGRRPISCSISNQVDGCADKTQYLIEVSRIENP